MAKINDPVFGTLRNPEEVLWWGKADRTPIGDKVKLVVEMEEEGDPPDDLQREAFRRFMAMDPSIRQRAGKVVYDHYVAVADNYRRFMTPSEAAEQVPPLADEGGIWDLIWSPSVYVPLQTAGPDRRWVMLDWNCSWDMDQGIRVMLENEQIKQVLGQGDGWE